MNNHTGNTETYTNNLGLIKPGYNDGYNVDKFNNNSDLIDMTVTNMQNNLSNVSNNLGTVENTVSNLSNITNNNSINIGSLNTRVSTLENNYLNIDNIANAIINGETQS